MFSLNAVSDTTIDPPAGMGLSLMLVTALPLDDAPAEAEESDTCEVCVVSACCQCRANVAHTRPYSGLAFQVKVLKTVPSLLGRGVGLSVMLVTALPLVDAPADADESVTCS